MGQIGEEEKSIFGPAGQGGRANRKTRATRTQNGKVQLARHTGKLRQKSIAPQVRRDLLRKDRLKALKERIHGTEEGKTAEEKLATIEREDFNKPVFGVMTIRSQKKKLFV